MPANSVATVAAMLVSTVAVSSATTVVRVVSGSATAINSSATVINATVMIDPRLTRPEVAPDEKAAVSRVTV